MPEDYSADADVPSPGNPSGFQGKGHLGTAMHSDPIGSGGDTGITSPPRLLFWETTKRCNLRCVHCRAEASEDLLPGELTTAQALGVLDSIANYAKPLLIFSGGEPLYRKDLFEILAHARSLGFRMALATNGTLIDQAMAKRIRESGVARVAVSLDGPTPEIHDVFRQVKGSFARTVRALELLRAEGLSTQVNTTVTRHNLETLPRMLEVVKELGVDAFHIFLLVPVGCGLTIEEEKQIKPGEYEKVLKWFYRAMETSDLEMKATCAPHFFRVAAQEMQRNPSGAGRFEEQIKRHQAKTGHGHPSGLHAMTRGCLAGSGVGFISHDGRVYPCGYLPLEAGDLKRQPFQEVWETSRVFHSLRNPNLLGGKCGLCEHKVACGGCRARAYGVTGDYLGEEPFCAYIPPEARKKGQRAVTA
jgi:AdoMet-dependent heme synthase